MGRPRPADQPADRPQIGYAPGSPDLTYRDLDRYINRAAYGHDARLLAVVHELCTRVRQLEYEIDQLKRRGRHPSIDLFPEAS